MASIGGEMALREYGSPMEIAKAMIRGDYEISNNNEAMKLIDTPIMLAAIANCILYTDAGKLRQEGGS